MDDNRVKGVCTYNVNLLSTLVGVGIDIVDGLVGGHQEPLLV